MIKERLFTPIRSFGQGVPAPAIEFDMKIQKFSAGEGHYYQAVFSNFRAAKDRDICLALYQQFAKSASKMFADEYDQRDADNQERTVNEPPPPTSEHEGGLEYPNFDNKDQIPF